MNGFLRSKLVLTLAVLIMIAVAIAVPLTSSNSRVHAASASSQTSWSIVSSPNPSTSSNELQAVSAYGANNAWAVGSYDGRTHVLIEHWNGISWTQQTGANPGANYNYLLGVKALSATNIWAVGSYDGNMLIEHSTDGGSTWTQDTSSYTGSGGLSAIDGDPSSGDAWAVGKESSEHALILHLVNGHFSVQNISSTSETLVSVSEHSSRDVWAVGFGSLSSHTFTVHYDGSHWTPYASPDLPFNDINDLDGVTDIGPDNAWAVGTSTNNLSGTGTLIHWNGSAWSTTPLTVTIGQNSTLDAVAADSSGNIWAAGGYTAPGFTSYHPLIWHSSDRGSTWYQETTESDPNSNGSIFSGIAIGLTTSNTWAVGSTQNYSSSSVTSKTLIEQYTCHKKRCAMLSVLIPVVFAP